jgi:hypothetical protein
MVVGQFGFADAVMCFQRIVSGIGQLAMEFKRANVRGILEAQAAGRECFVQNRKGDLERLDR